MSTLNIELAQLKLKTKNSYIGIKTASCNSIGFSFLVSDLKHTRKGNTVIIPLFASYISQESVCFNGRFLSSLCEYLDIPPFNGRSVIPNKHTKYTSSKQFSTWRLHSSHHSSTRTPHHPPPPYCRIYASVNRVSIGLDKMCRLFGAKPLSIAMLGYYQLNKLQWNFNQNTTLSIHENASKISSAKWWPFCPGGDELNPYLPFHSMIPWRPMDTHTFRQCPGTHYSDNEHIALGIPP